MVLYMGISISNVGEMKKGSGAGTSSRRRTILGLHLRATQHNRPGDQK